jgi:hypothetical protein
MDLMDTCYYAGKPGLRHWNGELELLELEHKRRIPFCWILAKFAKFYSEVSELNSLNERKRKK